MTWLRRLRSGRNLQPTTVAELPRDASVSDGESTLGSWIRAAFGAGPDAERAESDALARLQADPTAADQIVAAYRAAREDEYSLRWALAHAAAELRSPQALAFLDELVREPIPAERSPDFHHSTVGQELTIRFQAAGGLQKLTAEGNAEARELLLASVTHPAAAVRAMTVQLIRELPDRPISDDDIQARFRAGEWEQASAIRRVRVDEAETDRDGPAARDRTAPPGPERRPGTPPRSDRRPPRVGA